MIDLQLEGRVAIVTGASRGLGAAIAGALLAQGMQLLAVAREAESLEPLVAAHGRRVLAAGCDSADAGAVGALVPAALDRFGRLDGVVSNAGIAPAARFEQMALETWHEVLAVNLLAPVALARAAAPVFFGQGHGKVVNVASTSGLRGKPLLAAYSSSKGALLRMTEALAGEWASRNVQVNAIAPGAFSTDAQQAVLADAETLRRRLRKIPAGRMGEPSEIGPLACYLLSPLSDFVTGSVFVIDGGESSKL